MTDSTGRCLAPYEEQRLAALAGYDILDTPVDPAFDEIVEVVSYICDAPIAVINFVDRERQWFKSVKGLQVRETPLDISICAHAILQPGLFIIPDTTQDSRFLHNPLVTGEPHLRFYAGALLESADGYPLGTLCVLDYRARALNERQQFALQAMANQVMVHMELMRAHRQQQVLIQELERARSDLSRKAFTDSLTGLLNRRAFEQRMAQELAAISRGAPSAALLMMDLDHFKAINDEYGHGVGDQMLTGVAGVCREVFRQADVISRWGGEEFVCIMPGTSVEQAGYAAERLHQLLARKPLLEQNAMPLHVTVSIGICALTSGCSLEERMATADRLMYRAKAQGRNCTLVE